jgi:hypothetical protein
MSICIVSGYCYNLIVIHTRIIVFLLRVFMHWLPLFHGVIIFWYFMQSWRHLLILISGNYITPYTFFPNTEEIINSASYFSRRGTWWFSWMRHGATSLKVAGSIPNGVTGILLLTLPFWPHYDPGVDSVSNRNISWSGRCTGLTTLPPFIPIVSKSRSLNLLERFEPVLGLYRDFFIFALLFEEIIFLWYFWHQILFFPS